MKCVIGLREIVVFLLGCGGYIARSCVGRARDDFRWILQVYESVKPVTPTGGLVWHRLGAKTMEIIHENIEVETVRDDPTLW